MLDRVRHLPPDQAGPVAANLLDRQAAMTVWLTGLPCSGKTTLALGAQARLAGAGIAVRVLDGDDLRSGLNKDLGYSPEDRSENIRRVAEVARLFNESGVTVLVAVISPLAADRRLARAIVGPDRFIEVFLSTRVEVCEKRDVKGMYARARRGELQGFTGVGAPYETPLAPDRSIDTAASSIEGAVDEIVTTFASAAAQLAARLRPSRLRS